MKQISLTCVRHGEATHNVSIGYSMRMTEDGSAADTSLTPRGEKQAEVVAERLAQETFDLAASSDLERACNTALAILEHHPDVKLQQWKCVREPRGQDKWDRISEQIDQLLPRLINLAKNADQNPIKILIVSHSKFLYQLHRHLGHNFPHSNKENFSDADFKKKMINTGVSKFEIMVNEETETIEDVRCILWGCDSHLSEHKIGAWCQKRHQQWTINHMKKQCSTQ